MRKSSRAIAYALDETFVKDAPCKSDHCWNLPIANGLPAIAQPSGHSIMISPCAGNLRSVLFSLNQVLKLWLPLPCRPGPVASLVRIVGTYEKSLSMMARSHITRSEHSPFRIVPQRGQVPENNVKSPRSEYWAVFHEDVARSYFANDPRHVLPHSAALSGDACALPGCADVLAREASRYHVNKSAPWSSVKGLNVIPNRERREKAFILSGGKYSSGVGFPLDCTDAFPSEELSSKDAASGSCEERHFS